MGARIVYSQPFGRGGVVEGLVGGDQRHRGETGVLVLLADRRVRRRTQAVPSSWT
ncbi:MAG: hypothetical protein ACLQIB_44320 [Isosphaeraceae bacterium]